MAIALATAMVTTSAGGEAPADQTAGTPASAAAPADARVASGQKAYARHCLTCHQSDGYGVPNLQPAIVGGTWVAGDPRALAMFVMTGGFNSAERKESDSHNVMPSFGHLPDGELADLLTYIRQKFGNGASPVGASEVAEVRASL
jgi:mono/diheme cytochrome c family protein